LAIAATATTGAKSITVTTAAGTSNAVTFTVNASAGGTPPTAANRATNQTGTTPVTVNLLLGDTFPGSSFGGAATIVTNPAHGTVALTTTATTASVVYTRAAGVPAGGADTFTYTVTAANGLTSNTATVTINLK
jgi:hypothetical protein